MASYPSNDRRVKGSRRDFRRHRLATPTAGLSTISMAPAIEGWRVREKIFQIIRSTEVLIHRPRCPSRESGYRAFQSICPPRLFTESTSFVLWRERNNRMKQKSMFQADPRETRQAGSFKEEGGERSRVPSLNPHRAQVAVRKVNMPDTIIWLPKLF